MSSANHVLDDQENVHALSNRNKPEEPRQPLRDVTNSIKRPRSNSTAIPVVHKKAKCHFAQRIEINSNIERPLEDALDDKDPQMCTEYADEIYTLLYEQQEQFMVDPAYISRMPLTHKWKHNRHTLINWMSMVHKRFRLVAETLYLAVNIVDRYLSENQIPLDEIQVVGSTALLVSAKYEEIMPPAISNFAVIANTTEDQIRKTEIKILLCQKFDLGMPNPLNFLRRLSRADDYDLETRTISKFLLECMLYEPKLMVYRPSDVAAAAVYFTREILDLEPWNSKLEYYSGGCTCQGLQPIVQILEQYLLDPCEKQDPDFIKKYLSKRYLKASLIAINWTRLKHQAESP